MVTSFKRNRNHLIAGQFAAAADGVRDFAGLAQGITNPAVLVTDDHERAEIETASAFDDFGGTVDEDDLFRQFFGAAFFKGVFRRITRGFATTAATTRTALIATLSSFIKFSHSILWVAG